MRERPILFSGPMVKAILEGRKTQTRRIVKFKDRINHGETDICDNWPLWWDDYGDCHRQECPQGSVGDRLWVRETHFLTYRNHWPDLNPKIHNSNIMGGESVCNKYCFHKVGFDRSTSGIRWRPSIYMPRWASRITLEVTGVRVERLQDITDEDAQAEGIFFKDYGKVCFHPKPCPLPNNHEYHLQKNGWSHKKSTSDAECIGSPRFAFARLWNSINSKRAPWDSNPWLWVIEFKKI